MNQRSASRTAMLVSALRARASARPQPLCSDPWAVQLAGEVGMALADRHEQLYPASELWIALRTAWIDERIRRLCAPRGERRQVVLPGAGLDTRPARMGGDGLRWGDHRTKNYHLARSTSGGRSWSKATELRDANGHGVGTARPRLLLLGSKLLLSGGRLTTEQQGGIFLWISDDGFGRAWRTTSLSFKHNQLESDPALRFPDTVNTTLDLPGCVSKGKPWPDCPKDKSKMGCPHHFKNCSSTGYTSLLPAGDDAVVVYDGPPGIFAMRVSLADEDVQ